MKPLDKRSRPAVIALCLLGSVCFYWLCWLCFWQPSPLYGERMSGRIQELTYDYRHAVWVAHLDAHTYQVPVSVVRDDDGTWTVVYVAPAGAPLLPY